MVLLWWSHHDEVYCTYLTCYAGRRIYVSMYEYVRMRTVGLLNSDRIIFSTQLQRNLRPDLDSSRKSDPDGILEYLFRVSYGPYVYPSI